MALEGLDMDAVGIFLSVVALLTAALAHSEFAKARRMYRVFMTGTDQGNLEQVLLAQAARLEHLEQERQSQGKQLWEVEQKLAQAIQKVGMVRFNAFSDVGGEMSFAIALLDAQGSGVVVSSIYGRAEARVYAKPVVKGGTSSSLSKEERAAIEQAIETNK